MKLQSIPERYTILNRWKKFACPKFVGTFIWQDVDVYVSASNDVVYDFYRCFGLIRGTKHMREFRLDMRELKDVSILILFIHLHWEMAKIMNGSLILPPDMMKTKESDSR